MRKVTLQLSWTNRRGASRKQFRTSVARQLGTRVYGVRCRASSRAEPYSNEVGRRVAGAPRRQVEDESYAPCYK